MAIPPISLHPHPIEGVRLAPSKIRSDSPSSSTMPDAICRLDHEPPSILGRVEDLACKRDSRDLEDNAKLLEELFEKNKFPAEVNDLLSKLSRIELKLLLLWLQFIDLWFFVGYVCEYVKADTDSDFIRMMEELLTIGIFTKSESKEYIKRFTEEQSINKAIFNRVSEVSIALCKIKKVDIASMDQKITDQVTALIHSSPGLPATIGDQSEYQRHFLETVNNTKNLMASKSIETSCFQTCLDYIGKERHKMGSDSGVPLYQFGFRRTPLKGGHEDQFHTLISGPYKKYLETFLKSDKVEWKKEIRYHQIIYTLFIKLPSSDSLVEMTSLRMYWLNENSALWMEGIGPRAVWNHTPIKSIEPALNEAERLFNLVLELPVTRDTIGLERIMSGVGEVHWWLASACPFKRGSAAIAKMMACALLKYHGIEAGGFGDIEPDCMALIQTPSTFAANYSSLMQRPPPQWSIA